MICNAACAADVPVNPSVGCEVDDRPGGIGQFIFMKCDSEFTDITDLTEWTTKIAANEVHASGELLGSKPQGSFNKRKTSSCAPERTTSATKQVDFSDFNTDDDPNFGVHTWWNTIADTPGKWRFAWLTCDGLLYAWIDDIDIEVDEQIEEDKEGNSFIAGSVFWNKKLMTVPQRIPGLKATLG